MDGHAVRVSAEGSPNKREAQGPLDTNATNPATNPATKRATITMRSACQGKVYRRRKTGLGDLWTKSAKKEPRMHPASPELTLRCGDELRTQSVRPDIAGYTPSEAFMNVAPAMDDSP